MDEQPLPGQPIQEIIPLVIPDGSPVPPIEKFSNATRAHPELRCSADNKAGARCGYPKTKGKEFCYWHDPDITPEQRLQARSSAPRRPILRKSTLVKVKTMKDILRLLSGRIDLFMERWKDTADVDVEQTLCDMCKTYVLVHKCSTDEEARQVVNFRLNRRLA